MSHSPVKSWQVAKWLGRVPAVVMALGRALRATREAFTLGLGGGAADLEPILALDLEAVDVAGHRAINRAPGPLAFRPVLGAGTFLDAKLAIQHLIVLAALEFFVAAHDGAWLAGVDFSADRAAMALLLGGVIGDTKLLAVALVLVLVLAVALNDFGAHLLLWVGGEIS